MNTSTKTAAVAALVVASAPASAEFSANLGYMSDYYFRGVFQKSSSANGGLDYEKGGFYAGVWAADVGGGSTGDGLEVDGYFGYGGLVGNFSYGIGFTGYYYTGDFDDTYQEINLSAGYGFVTLDVALGEYSNFGGPSRPAMIFLGRLSVEHAGFWEMPVRHIQQRFRRRLRADRIWQDRRRH